MKKNLVVTAVLLGLSTSASFSMTDNQAEICDTQMQTKISQDNRHRMMTIIEKAHDLANTEFETEFKDISPDRRVYLKGELKEKYSKLDRIEQLLLSLQTYAKEPTTEVRKLLGELISAISFRIEYVEEKVGKSEVLNDELFQKLIAATAKLTDEALASKVSIFESKPDLYSNLMNFIDSYHYIQTELSSNLTSILSAHLTNEENQGRRYN